MKAHKYIFATTSKLPEALSSCSGHFIIVVTIVLMVKLSSYAIVQISIVFFLSPFILSSLLSCVLHQSVFFWS